jgi:hypothetical protein
MAILKQKGRPIAQSELCQSLRLTSDELAHALEQLGATGVPPSRLGQGSPGFHCEPAGRLNYADGTTRLMPAVHVRGDRAMMGWTWDRNPPAKLVEVTGDCAIGWFRGESLILESGISIDDTK